MATQVTFNCYGASTALPALPRAYWCCGFDVPPLSFSGLYSCNATGGTAASVFDSCGTNVVDEPITLTLVNKCYPPQYTYESFEKAYLTIERLFCANSNCSDRINDVIVTFYFWSVSSPDIGSVTQSCSFVDGVYSFYYSATSTRTFADSSVLTKSIILNSVDMP